MADIDCDQETGEILPPRQQLPAAPASSAPNNLIFASADCAEVFGALAAAQGEMGNPKKTMTAKVKGQTRNGGSYDYEYKYAPLEEVVDAIRKPMSKAGLIYRQFLASRDGQWVMRTVIAHKSGQWFGCDYPIFTGRQEGAQGFASGVTYARRYGLMLALGVVAEDDDDANVAGGRPAEIASRGRGEGFVAEATQAPPARKPPPQRPQSAPTDAKKDDARKRYRLMSDQIAESPSPSDLDALMKSPAWAACAQAIYEAEGDQERTDNIIGRLMTQVEQRKEFLSVEMPTIAGGDYAQAD